MASYTYNTTAAEENALDWILARENERRARKGLGAITKVQLFDVGTRRLWVNYYQEQRNLDHMAMTTALVSATDTERDAIRTTLRPYIVESSV